MRLRTFTARTMGEAMERVRRELGDEAIIVSSRPARDEGGILVTAAVEQVDEAMPEPANAPEPAGDGEPGDIGTLITALQFHNTPLGLTDRLVDVALEAETGDPALALAAALEQSFRFAPLGAGASGHPIMLVGGAGCGKTVTAARIAAAATLNRTPIEVITCDTRRAGGIDQLAAFTRILRIGLRVAESPAALRAVLKECRRGAPVLIDTPAAGLHDRAALAELAELAAVAEAEPVMVMAAGGDPLDCADAAAAFADLGVRRFVATRLDETRRYGGVLAAGSTLAFAEASMSPRIADPLRPLNPLTLARLLLGRHDNAGQPARPAEVPA